MTEELRTTAWNCLPKEFKEEVKRMWCVEDDCTTKYKSERHKHRINLLYELFGDWQNNLTSDAEGEEDEMLYVERRKVQKLYLNYVQEHKSDISNPTNNVCVNRVSLGARIAMLQELFGSKCLPDEISDRALKPVEECFVGREPKFHKGDKVEVINYDGGLPSLERCVHEVFTVSDVKYDANQWMYKLETDKCLFNERDYLKSIQWCEHFLKPYKEPKPDESKLKVGDKAVMRGFKHPLLEQDGAIVTILSYHEKGDFYSCAIAPNVGIDVDAKYLEPYTEPKEDLNPSNSGGGIKITRS